jgi:hypothetical protein
VQPGKSTRSPLHVAGCSKLDSIRSIDSPAMRMTGRWTDVAPEPSHRRSAVMRIWFMASIS